jgi:hypothetical protein
LTNERDRTEQARANLLKVIRSAVRLRHSIAADEELNVKLPAAEQVFNAQVLRGELPDPVDVLRQLEEED